MMVRRAGIVALATALSAGASNGQEYRVRVDAGLQAASFRGLRADSIPVGSAVVGSTGGFETPDGFAVRCGAASHCFFFRPGPALRAVPFTTAASVTLWGLGVEGLSAHGDVRLVADLGGDGVWPAADPFVQVLEGYLEYQRSTLVARAGRQIVFSRLEPMGYDGAWLKARWDSSALEIVGYAGWGLGQAAVLPFTSPALNPLDEWRPRKRQIVAGAEVSWVRDAVDARAEYRREIDPFDHRFVSERAAVSLGARAAGVGAVAGLDYDIAMGHVGSADLNLTYARPRYSISSGMRRYRPYFNLWTLWGAFSPVPYAAVHAAARYDATSALTLSARAERYRYDAAEVSTSLVRGLRDDGWRTSLGATFSLATRWTIDANFAREAGVGAAGRFFDAGVEYRPDARYAVAVNGGAMQRPLELRYFDADTKWVGGRAEWNATPDRRVWVDVAVTDDSRDRPDAAASSVSQVRLRAGVRLSFGSSADRVPLPPARPLGR